jgi:hypothetical protein
MVQLSPAVAAEPATDGWQHSLVSESLEAPAPTSATDGWQTSLASDSAKTATVATDGWQTSLTVLAERDTTETQLAATDGWLGSIVGDEARAAEQPRIAQVPASASSSSYGYMDDIAFGSAILNVILIAAGSIVLLRQRRGGMTS